MTGIRWWVLAFGLLVAASVALVISVLASRNIGLAWLGVGLAAASLVAAFVSLRRPKE